MNGRVLRTAEQMAAASLAASAKRAEQRAAIDVRKKQEADPATKLMREIGALTGGHQTYKASWRLKRLEAIAKKEEFWRVLLAQDLERRFAIMERFAGTWASLTMEAWEAERPF